ncbi:MAG: S41 family peptidase, partial [Henriciella sp.]
VQSDEELFDRLAGMIDGFSDSHTKLLASVDGESRRQQDGLGQTLSFIRAADQETPWLIGIFGGLVEEVLDPGSQHTANDRILWGTLDDGRVGYIQVLQMGGFSGVDIGDPHFREAEFEVFDTVMDDALAAMSNSEFVILDLSNNRGGYDAISRRLASRFTDQAFDAYLTHVPGSGVAPRMRMVYPANGVRYSGPVKLLTSDVTVSGGEIATLALRQLPNVTHYGTTTRGSFSTVLSKPLPNGWVVELANEVVAAPDGTSFEETGIEPEEIVEVFPRDEPVLGHRQAIEYLASSNAP